MKSPGPTGTQLLTCPISVFVQFPMSGRNSSVRVKPHSHYVVASVFAFASNATLRLWDVVSNAENENSFFVFAVKLQKKMQKAHSVNGP